MSVPARPKTARSIAPKGLHAPATAWQQDRYRVLLDAEVGRLTLELRRPRHQRQQITGPEEGHQPIR